LQVELSNGSYLRKIAAARTFGSREDEKAMRNMGLIRAHPAKTASSSLATESKTAVCASPTNSSATKFWI